jgi:hypothetical protein
MGQDLTWHSSSTPERTLRSPSATSFTLAILLHLSLLFEDKNVPYVSVLSKMALELSCK